MVLQQAGHKLRRQLLVLNKAGDAGRAFDGIQQLIHISGEIFPCIGSSNKGDHQNKYRTDTESRANNADYRSEQNAFAEWVNHSGWSSNMIFTEGATLLLAT